MTQAHTKKTAHSTTIIFHRAPMTEFEWSHFFHSALVKTAANPTGDFFSVLTKAILQTTGVHSGFILTAMESDSAPDLNTKEERLIVSFRMDWHALGNPYPACGWFHFVVRIHCFRFHIYTRDQPYERLVLHSYGEERLFLSGSRLQPRSELRFAIV